MGSVADSQLKIIEEAMLRIAVARGLRETAVAKGEERHAAF
jgi:hypothetical protein